MSATLHDVSRLAGVSIKTVSNVINDYPYVRESTRQKVLAAIAQLDYTPNLSARSLRSGKTNVIGLLIPELRNAYFAELADSVMRAAAARGQSVLIQQFGNDRESELSVLRTRRAGTVDGLLYSVLTLGEADRPTIEELPLPVVLLGERLFGSARDHVTMQNVQAARAATGHLLRSGRRRLVALGAGPADVVGSAGLRLTGYRQALDDAGLPFDTQLAVPAESWHRSGGYRAMRGFLERGVAFDGVVAFNDTLALGAMRALQDHGLRIPGDVAITGFDDIDETQFSMPALTTIDPGRDQIAETAIDLLLERIAGGADGAPREVAVPFRLIERESTVRATGAV